MGNVLFILLANNLIIADNIKPNCFHWLDKYSIYTLWYNGWQLCTFKVGLQSNNKHKKEESQHAVVKLTL